MKLHEIMPYVLGGVWYTVSTNCRVTPQPIHIAGALSFAGRSFRLKIKHDEN